MKNLNVLLQKLSILPSFTNRIYFCNQNFTKMVSGSSRIVYLLPNGNQVLKLAKNQKGIAQNSTESDAMLQTVVTNKMLQSDPNDLWLITSLATKMTKNKFLQLTKLNFDQYSQALQYWNNQFKNLKHHIIEPINYEEIINTDFFSEVIDLIGNYNLTIGDLTRINSYGEVNGQAVIIDFGCTDEIHQQFYRRK